MASLYILYSKTLDRFNTGSCKDLSFRLNQHLEKIYSKSFTSKANDWEIFLVLGNLSYKQARFIESHIKRMKSKVYIQNLKKYPEIINKVKDKFALSEGDHDPAFKGIIGVMGCNYYKQQTGND